MLTKGISLLEPPFMSPDDDITLASMADRVEGTVIGPAVSRSLAGIDIGGFHDKIKGIFDLGIELLES